MIFTQEYNGTNLLVMMPVNDNLPVTIRSLKTVHEINCTLDLLRAELAGLLWELDRQGDLRSGMPPDKNRTAVILGQLRDHVSELKQHAEDLI